MNGVLKLKKEGSYWYHKNYVAVIDIAV